MFPYRDLLNSAGFGACFLGLGDNIWCQCSKGKKNLFASRKDGWEIRAKISSQLICAKPALSWSCFGESSPATLHQIFSAAPPSSQICTNRTKNAPEMVQQIDSALLLLRDPCMSDISSHSSLSHGNIAPFPSLTRDTSLFLNWDLQRESGIKTS